MEDLIARLLPTLIAAAVFGGLAAATTVAVLKSDLKSLRTFLTSELQAIREDVSELKASAQHLDERLRKVEVSQAEREGRDKALAQMKDK